MAVTDDERREVAERLRAGVGRGMPLILNVAFAAFEVDPVSLDRTVTSDEAAMRLADLIDPDCEEGRYEGVRTVRPVDREALLALADKMKRMPQCDLCPAEIVDCSAHPDGCPSALLDYYARRIREACGEAVA